MIINPRGEHKKKEKYRKLAESRADKMRDKPTGFEKVLMDELDKQGIKYQFQVPVSDESHCYILDFVIRGNTCVELDGSQHYTTEGKKWDRQRSAYLRSIGYQVIRFANMRVIKDMPAVITEIRKKAYAKINEYSEKPKDISHLCTQL